MTLRFRADDIQVTDDWIRTGTNTIPISDVRRAWVTRRQLGRGSRLTTAVLGFAVILIIIGAAGATGLLTRYWVWLLAAPVIFLAVAWVGLLDPVAIYLEKRHHELWIATDSMAIRLWRANSVEVNKALRAIQRAVEQYTESVNDL